MPTEVDNIPIVDLSLYESSKDLLAKNIVKICEDIGFFYVINHGVADRVYKNITELSQAFFSASDVLKNEIKFNPINRRGYTNAKGTSREKNECVRLGIDLPKGHSESEKCPQLQGPNPIPSFIPGFKNVVDNYLVELNKVAIKLLNLFAIGLGREENFFSRNANNPLSTLLLLKYPKMSAMPSGIEGCREHTDFHCLTILKQDNTGGLQVKNKTGQWIDATPIPNSFVVNIGDLLSYWSGGRFIATPHRVLRIINKERYSIPYFYNVDYDTLISPIGSNKELPSRHVGKYVLDRVNSVYIDKIG